MIVKDVAVHCNRDRMLKKKINKRWAIVPFLFWIICLLTSNVVFCRQRLFRVLSCIKKYVSLHRLRTYGYVRVDASFHGAVSRSQWTLSSPDGRVLPTEGQAGGVKEGPSGPHTVGRWSGQ